MGIKKKVGRSVFALLAITLLVQSFSSVFVKIAGRYPVMSEKFLLYYGLAILCLGVFSIMWQFLLERIPLTTAYLRKGISYILVLAWSVLIFHENITWNNILGSVIIIIGVVISSHDH